MTKLLIFVFLSLSILCPAQKIKYTINNGLQIEGVDQTNPILYDNDIIQDTPDIYYLWLKANRGQAKLVGVVCTKDMHPQSGSHDSYFSRFTEFYNKAVAAGLKNIPAPVKGAPSPTAKPASGVIEQTPFVSSVGSDLIIAEAKKASAAKPLIIVVGGNVSSIAHAYLKDNSIAPNIIVIHVAGYSKTTTYNTMDSWSTYIVMKKFRYINWSGNSFSYYNGVKPIPTSADLTGMPSNSWTQTLRDNWIGQSYAQNKDISDAPPTMYFFTHSLWKNVSRRMETDAVTTSDNFDYLLVSDNDWTSYGPLLMNYIKDPANHVPGGTTPPPTNIPPIVSITNGLSYNLGPVTLTADAADPDGSVTKVEFFNGTTKLGEDVSAPYTYNWLPGVGSYQISAKATDNKGAVTTSSTVTINIIPIIVPPDGGDCITCPQNVFKIGQVATLLPGVLAYVTIRNTATNEWTLDFGIPAGANGQCPVCTGLPGGGTYDNLYNVKSYGGAVGNGSNDDTAGFQKAFDGAIQFDGDVMIPSPSGFWKLTNTINVVPPGGAGQVWVDVIAQGRSGDIKYQGPSGSEGNKKVVFNIKGLKGSVWEGMMLSLSGSYIVGYDIDGTPSIESSSFVTFKNFYTSLGNQPENEGFRLGHFSGGDGHTDISNYQWENSVVFGNQGAAVPQVGQIAYHIEGVNTLSQTWMGGFTAFVDKNYTNVSGPGAQSGRGNGSVFFYGLGTSQNNVDFTCAWEQQYLIAGCRSEGVKQKFLHVSAGGLSSVTIMNAQIHDAQAAGSIIQADVATSLSIINSQVTWTGTNGKKYNPVISLTNNSSNTGTLFVQGGGFSADNLYTISGTPNTWDITVLGANKVNIQYGRGYFTNEVGIKH